MVLTVFSSVSSAQIVLSNEYYEAASLSGTTVEMHGLSELHITGSGTPLTGCTINMNSIDSWVFVHEIAPSTIISSYLGQFQVEGAAAVNNTNVKVVQHGQGAVVIPHPSSFQPLTVYDGENFSGASESLSPHTAYGTVLEGRISSFVLKRGYMATFAANSSGSKESINYVAADGDLEIGALPTGLNDQVRFIRVFPWRWVTKKGSCDVDPTKLDAKWHYNWDINKNSANNWEYVAIKQQPNWPGLNQNWESRGVNHLLGFNEPNNPVEDAYKNLNPNGSVSDAVARSPELLGTGLRLGAPAVTDGGYSWIVDFINGCDAAGYRLDYVPIHYYRSQWDNDPATAANNMYNFLKGIYDVAKRPIWVTEFNNGANWTDNAHDPTTSENRDVIEAMVNMMDNTPWIERYAIYSNVEWFRKTHYDDGSLTPMGSMYKAHEAPLSYIQAMKKNRSRVASYYFENNCRDDSGCGNNGFAVDIPVYSSGKHGQAIELGGACKYVQLPGDIASSSSFSFAAWVYWNGGADYQRIFDFGNYDTSAYQYMILTPRTAGGKMAFGLRNGSGSTKWISTSSALPSGSWQHVAVTRSGTATKIYLNGVQQASGTISEPALSGTLYNYLGKSQWPHDPLFSGKMDDVHIYNYAISQSTISSLMDTAPPQAGTNLVDGGSVTVDEVYSGSVAGSVTDPEGGAVIYKKIYGAAWLTVGTDGSLSGTPAYADEGTQYFTLRASDANGARTHIVLQLNVELPPNVFQRGPVAHWDFNDSSLGAANGAAVPDSDGYTVWREAATDKSGNGNHLTTWEHGWAGFDWSTSSSQGDFSIVAAGSYPAAFTWSDESAPTGIDLETVSLTNFTVEALFTATGSGNRTVLGRDGKDLSTSAPDNAAVYFGLDGSHQPLIEFTDENGDRVRLISSTSVANNNSTWYHLAGVYDGSTLSLYLDDSLIASTSVSMGAIARDTVAGSGYHAGGWSVGRGLWAGGHTDRWTGKIDAVAISGVALEPGSFVITGTWPEPYEFYFNDYGIAGAEFDGDADSNGVPNGMEYYLGTNPNNASTPTNVLTFTSNYLSVVHPFNPLASGVTGAVEWTSDLMSSNWFNSGVTYVTNDSPDEIEAILGGTSTTNQIFLRLRVDN